MAYGLFFLFDQVHIAVRIRYGGDAKAIETRDRTSTHTKVGAVLPVVDVESHSVAEGQVGPIAKQLKQAFDAEVKAQCGS